MEIRRRLGAPTWFFHSLAIQAAFAVESGGASEVALSELLDACREANTPFARFKTRAPARFKAAGYEWLDETEFRRIFERDFGAWNPDWDKPWPETYPRPGA